MTEHDSVKPPPNVDKLFLNTTLQCNDGLLKQKKNRSVVPPPKSDLCLINLEVS